MDEEDRRDPESEKLRSAISDILHERHYQTARWSREHDKDHTPQEWAAILTVWLGKATSHVPPYTSQDSQKDNESFRKRLVQIAAICVAAIEALDQK